MFGGQVSHGAISWQKLWKHFRSARLWQNFPRRVDREWRIVQSVHGPAGTGLSDAGKSEHGASFNQRQYLSVKLLGVLLVCLAGCTHRTNQDPQALYDQIRLTFTHGQLVSAQEQAEKARLYFSNRDSQWESRFRFLEAEILVWRGLNQNALSLLNAELPASLAKGDLAIRQLLLRGIAYARLGQLNEAGENLNNSCAALFLIPLHASGRT